MKDIGAIQAVKDSFQRPLACGQKLGDIHRDQGDHADMLAEDRTSVRLAEKVDGSDQRQEQRGNDKKQTERLHGQNSQYSGKFLIALNRLGMNRTLQVR